MWTTPNRLYLNKDKSAVVPEGSVEAASLLAAAGHQIADDVCQRYGLGPYAPAQDATEDATGTEDAEATTDTEPETEGPQIDPQDVPIGEEAPEPEKTVAEVVETISKPRRRR